MKAGPLLRISVSIAAESEDAVCELLGGLSGQPASVYHDAESGDVTASVYLAGANHWPAAQREALRAGLRRIRECGLNIGSGKVSARRVRREDWAESWKRHFKPIRVGGVLLLKPSWGKLRARPGQKTVVLDPGLSFGTGQHPTTRFCLEQIVAARNRDSSQSLLDIGTGSGILAIAAVKLGYCPVEALALRCLADWQPHLRAGAGLLFGPVRSFVFGAAERRASFLGSGQCLIAHER